MKRQEPQDYFERQKLILFLLTNSKKKFFVPRRRTKMETNLCCSQNLKNVLLTDEHDWEHMHISLCVCVCVCWWAGKGHLQRCSWTVLFSHPRFHFAKGKAGIESICFIFQKSFCDHYPSLFCDGPHKTKITFWMKRSEMSPHLKCQILMTFMKAVTNAVTCVFRPFTPFPV